ncbi:hypothetical protein EUGRSUZ_E01514 [Eucalyptus grandis]|uniref:Uncharacterized protein n=2 Tax=Eucalyptus grandis TaxID=71139 RepID=A0A059C3Y8_EUCGR|nr:hypothetical protein EUGRSUZ_E01514 [Eucalyptus grandis]
MASNLNNSTNRKCLTRLFIIHICLSRSLRAVSCFGRAFGALNFLCLLELLIVLLSQNPSISRVIIYNLLQLICLDFACR